MQTDDAPPSKKRKTAETEGDELAADTIAADGEEDEEEDEEDEEAQDPEADEDGEDEALDDDEPAEPVNGHSELPIKAKVLEPEAPAAADEVKAVATNGDAAE
jgi:hypothetical protein